MPIVVTLCVYFVTFEPVSGEKERDEEDKENFAGREPWSALTFVTGLDESTGSTVEASAASASLGHDEIYGFGSYTDMCVHHSDQEEKRAVTFAYVAPLKGIVISGYFEPWDSFGPRVPRKVISCRGPRFLLHDI